MVGVPIHGESGQILDAHCDQSFFGSLTLSIGIEGHARQRFQNEPIMRPRCVGQWDSNNDTQPLRLASDAQRPAVSRRRWRYAHNVAVSRPGPRAFYHRRGYVVPWRRSRYHDASDIHHYILGFSSSSTSHYHNTTFFPLSLRGSVRKWRSGSELLPLYIHVYIRIYVPC